MWRARGFACGGVRPPLFVVVCAPVLQRGRVRDVQRPNPTALPRACVSQEEGEEPLTLDETRDLMRDCTLDAKEELKAELTGELIPILKSLERAVKQSQYQSQSQGAAVASPGGLPRSP